MFTGIVEEVGFLKKAGNGSLSVTASKVLRGTKIGDSICLNGVCLTVTSLSDREFTADVMPETFRRSNLLELTVGSPVNLERAMPADGRFGGHIVSGHIDGTGIIKEMKQDANAVVIRITAPESISLLVVEKGSVAIDGISLTVLDSASGSFRVSVIPHTLRETCLAYKKPGDKVNLENDIIGKYAAKLMDKEDSGRKRGITEDFLHKYGF